MILEQHTLNILKNFSIINPSILIESGNVLKTISATKTIMASANINQTFDKSFAIAELPNFLSAMSMFEKPNLIFNDDIMVKITSENDTRSIDYKFCNPELIVRPPAKNVNLGSDVNEFHLKSKSLSDIIKAIAIFNLPEIAIVGDGENITIRAVDSKKSGSTYHDIVGETNSKFSTILRAEYIKQLMVADYDVTVGRAVKFTSPVVTYWVAVETVK